MTALEDDAVASPRARYPSEPAGAFLAQRVAVSADALRPSTLEISSLVVLLAYFAAVQAWGNFAPFDLPNAIGPLLLTAILLSADIGMLKQNPACLWTPLFWMRVSVAVYFGLGTAAYSTMNWYTQIYVQNFHLLTQAHFDTFNLVTCTGTLVVLLTARLASYVVPQTLLRRRASFQGDILFFAVLAITGTTYLLKYAVVYPLRFAAMDVEYNSTLLGVVVLASNAGLFLLLTWCYRVHPSAIMFCLALLAGDVIVGLVSFNKSEALLPLIILALTSISHRPSLRRLVAFAFVIGVLYALLQSFAGYGRTIVEQRYGNITVGSFSERAQIALDYVRGDRTQGSDADDLQGVPARLGYVHVAAPAIDRVQSGIYGFSFDVLPIVLIPRILWSEKPILDLGAQYTQMVNGSRSSSNWMGVFLEAYWNMGCLGLLVAVVPYALAIFLISRYAVWVIETDRWLHMPAVLVGLFIGMRVDGGLVMEAFPFSVVVLLLAVVLEVATVAAEATIRATQRRSRIIR